MTNEEQRDQQPADPNEGRPTPDAGEGQPAPGAPGPDVNDAARSGGDDAARDELMCIIEALLFSSDRPVPASRLAEAAGAADARQARAVARQLQQEYEQRRSAFAGEEIAGGFQLLTRPEYAPYVSRLNSRRQQDTLSKAALETLAIVAYRQPITRAALEDIRGVASGHMLRALVERRLLKVAGRAEELGRPLLYATTRQFLEAFGLKSLNDLPKRADLAVPKGPPKPAVADAPAASADAPAEPETDAPPADQSPQGGDDENDA